jgi:hypothetical protein
VEDRPALEHRALELPASPRLVALEKKEAFAGSGEGEQAHELRS